jgi:hypothetical protein
MNKNDKMNGTITILSLMTEKFCTLSSLAEKNPVRVKKRKVTVKEKVKEIKIDQINGSYDCSFINTEPARFLLCRE